MDESGHRIYQYPVVNRILFLLFSLFACYLILGPIVFVILGIFPDGLNFWIVYPVMILFGLFPLFFANLYPDVIVNEQGLRVRFFLWSLLVKWNEIVEVRPSLINYIFPGRSFVVKTSSLTIFHRFYGLYGASFLPSFIISSSLNGYALLIDRIKQQKVNLDVKSVS